MATLHIVTVGTSVLRHLETSSRQHQEWGSAARLLRTRSDVVKRSISPNKNETAEAIWWLSLDPRQRSSLDMNPQLVRDITDVVNKHDWTDDRFQVFARVSAEINGFSRQVWGAKAPDSLVPPGDYVVALASDSDEGKVAGMWISAMLAADPLFGDVSYVEGLPVFADQQILLYPVPALTPGTFDHFPRELGQSIRGIYDAAIELKDDGAPRSRFHEIRFHLSGGYKAALPYYLAAAEWISARDNRDGQDGDNFKISAYALHEDPGMIDAMPLPVHRISVEGEREFISALSRGESAEPPKFRALEGRAYQLSGGRYSLTPYGEGLACFLE